MAEGWMKYWGQSRTSQETLEEYWEALMKRSDYHEQEEIKFFLHSSTLTGKERIQKSGKLIGGFTELPARAPLASNPELKGCWLAMSTKELPTKSPYGTQRLVMKVKPLLLFMSTPLPDNDDNSDDKYDVPSSDEDQGRGGSKRDKGKKKKKRPVKKNQKECYLKKQVPEKPHLETPLLFFECAHYYGTTQYVRLLLVRADDVNVDWCRATLKEVDIRRNPFFEMKWGRIFTYTSTGGKREIVVEILVVGDIVLNRLTPEKPTWDIVGTVSRAGFDPRLGVL